MVELYRLFAAKSLIRLLHYLCPWTDVMDATGSSNGLHETGGGEGAAEGLQFSLEKNFGEFEFNWNERSVSLRSFGEDPKAPPLLMAKVEMDQLSGHKTMPSSRLTPADFQAEENDPRHRLYESDWICINHRGRDTMDKQIAGHVATAVALIAVTSLPLLLPAFVALCVIRRWARRQVRPDAIYGKAGTRDGHIAPTRVSKRERLAAKCRAVASTLANQDLQKIPRVKLMARQKNGMRVSKMIPFKACDREMPQFS
jgi:hypothetical protein